MFTVAVAGPPLHEPTCEALVSDALADTLSPDRHPLRLLVPTAPDSLTEGVRAVVEWAWKQPQPPRTVAVYDGHLCYDDDEKVFLESGADEVLGATDVARMIVDELAGAMPDAALLVVLHEAEADALTTQIMSGCFDAGVPIFDVSHGAIPLCRQDVCGWEPEAVETVETPAEVEEPVAEDTPAPKMAVAPPVEVAAEGVPDEHDIIKELRREFVQIGRLAANAINRLDDVAEGKGWKSRPTTRGKIFISTDGGKTKRPRGRGKAPRNSIEYNDEGDVIRVN